MPETTAATFAGIDPIDPIDPLSAVTHPDPYPYYRELAATRPFFREPRLGLWVAAGPREVAAVLAHPDCRVRPPAQPVPPTLAGTAAGALFGRLIRMNDGAAHAPLKALLMPMLAAVDPGVAAQWAAAMARVLDAGEASPVAMPAASVNRWLFALPVVSVAAVLGLPVARDCGTALEGARQVAAFAAAQSPLADADTVRAGAEAARWLDTWLAPSLRGMAAADSPLPALQHAAQAAGIAAQAVAANIIGLLVQACEATAALAGNTLLWLGRNPSAGAMPLQGVVARVAQDDPPVQNTRRFVAADTGLCGHAVKAGETVLVLLAAASCRGLADDARAWTFGNGRHACPGDRLAQALAAATVSALCARGAEPAALARAFRYRPSLNARIPHFL
ncbi:putative cytochrome P450 family protein [Cupriavidus taiwanensis]|uniref:Cytochrome P450 family protein n=1 Tax=Cupriavidus taiwanensis TaxID=164546 RepID=A0A976A9T8_9BURK|nr:cytochrome P450 [Cupriavidus taiwanensis]SOY69412.1 putative cytochrome P450 family protein [Cupriavidus taiwanensis]